MPPFKILVCDDIAKEGLEIFAREKDMAVTVKTKQSLEELKAAIADADAAVVRSGTQLTAEVLSAARKLRVIGRAGVGLDNVDVEAASKKGVVVINTPGGNTTSAAEHTFCLLMALARNIPQADASMRRGEWERKKFTGVELYGKTLGVMGLGRIGSEVAKRAAAFGMRTVAYDPYLRSEKAGQIGVELVDMAKLLSLSDFITLHMPLSTDNKYILGEAELKKLKKGVRIINCARGGLIDEKALARAVQAGHVAGAALDVFENEPPKGSPFLALPQVILTPHLGASTEEAQIAVAVDVAVSIVDYLTGRGLKNAVNVPSVDPEVLAELRPYIQLGEKVGLLQAQLVAGQMLGVDIEYHGPVCDYPTTAITVAVIKGLLSTILAESVNYVNAPVLAKERGIKITESKSSTPISFANLIRVEVRTDRRRHSVAGTLFTREDPRIVMIDNFHVETVPSGYMLLVSNRDVPGIVGQVGTILGNNRINIAGMTFGRDTPGGQAMTLLNIDSVAPANVIEEIRKSKNVLDAKLIKL
ncbi:MAG: phosphoglycerate dehydrogenase [Omnitrophica bacterium RIFCSPHIGHO2_02_FULL_63_14]|nr:MAG: phosphoglycerate dehydrogenase [Omnitrophica bacterium RIFCSPHIGHO2_02_FULL_63_14]